MCKNLLPLLAACCWLAASAQAQTNVQNNVLNAGGQTINWTNGGTIEYSIGEVATITINPTGQPVTQGLLQPRSPKVGTQDLFDERYGFTCYPNPTTDFVTIETGYPDFDRISFSSTDGRVVQEGAFTYAPVDCHLLPPGLYFARLSSAHQSTLKIFKLLKQ